MENKEYSILIFIGIDLFIKVLKKTHNEKKRNREREGGGGERRDRHTVRPSNRHTQTDVQTDGIETGRGFALYLRTSHQNLMLKIAV